MTTYKWIKVMYLKMRRIILLLNYLGLLMNIHASIDRAYFFTKRLDVLRKKKKEKTYQIRMKLKSSFI